MFIRAAGRIALFTIALSVLSGCSDNGTGEVSGTITVDGVPVEKGAISFFPVNQKSPSAGGSIAGGKYVASNVPVGVAMVQIRVPKVVGKKKLYDTPDSPYRDLLDESLPNKYNDKTELRFDVKPGKNEKNWELSTK
jgi:hypothetical protein